MQDIACIQYEKTHRDLQLRYARVICHGHEKEVILELSQGILSYFVHVRTKLSLY